MKRLIAVAILLTITTPALAQSRTDARRIAKAAAVIHQAPVPSESAGAAYTKDVRFNWIPIVSFFGAFGSAGHGVVFDRDGAGTLTNPRIVHRAGIGGTATIGVGLPWSLSINERVLVFDSLAATNTFASKRHVSASAKLYAAAGVPGKLWVAETGPTIGSQPGGKVVWKRDVFVGLFASAGVSAEVKAQWPKREHHRVRR